jgi:hypothetical protein
MSGKQQIKKPADPPEPLQDETPVQQGASRPTSKSYGELMKGFTEIRKIQTNQEVFDKRGSTGSSFETIKKSAGDKENPDG